MWQTEALQRSLDAIDGHGARPVLRPAPLVPVAPIEMVRVERRRQLRGHRDSESPSDRPRELASGAACAALDCIDLAIILLHPDARVLHANAAARRAQARGDCFQISAHKLRLVDRHGQHLLDEFLSGRVKVASSSSGPICVTGRDNGSSCYFLFAEWLDYPSTCENIASLQIHEPRRAGQLEPALLGTLYGLTRMESSLVVALYSAPILQIAADQCGIALNTAKTHLKRVFTKCGVHSKAELLRLLALGPRIPV